MAFQLITKRADEVEVGERFVTSDGQRFFVESIRTLTGTIVLDTYHGQIHCSPDTPVTIAEYHEPTFEVDPAIVDENAGRVERARTIAEAYATETGLEVDADGAYTVVADLIADLLHYLASTGEDHPIAACNRAIEHFTEETQ